MIIAKKNHNSTFISATACNWFVGSYLFSRQCNSFTRLTRTSEEGQMGTTVLLVKQLTAGVKRKKPTMHTGSGMENWTELRWSHFLHPDSILILFCLLLFGGTSFKLLLFICLKSGNKMYVVSTHSHNLANGIPTGAKLCFTYSCVGVCLLNGFIDRRNSRHCTFHTMESNCKR